MEKDGVYLFPGIGGNSNSSIDPNLLLALNNGNGFGGNGNWIWVLFLWMMWQNGYGNNGLGGNSNGVGFLANQMNNDAGRDLLLQAINGRADALGQLAQITQSNIDNVRTVLGTIQSSIQTVGAQVGITSLETQQSVLLGNAGISRQICECCCENRLAIANQTAALQSQMAANDANIRLQLAQNEAADQLAVCQQTNTLSTQSERNTNSIINAINAQNTMLAQEFCSIKEREMQDKIDTQRDMITQLRGQISNDQQTLIFNRAIAALDDKIDAIAAKQPNTVPVQWPNLIAANATPYVGGYGYGYGNGNGFGGSIIF